MFRINRLAGLNVARPVFKRNLSSVGPKDPPP